MKALTYIEIDIPFCAHSFGVAPCTATLAGPNPTGTIKCFNSPKTCQDRVNFLDAPVTLRFAQDVGFLPDDIDVIPSVTGISLTPATVSLGKDLGTRGSISVTFKDHPWADTAAGFDKYVGERPYNPYLQGSFWAKFRARQPFLRGRPLRLIRGLLGQALGDMETRHYLIDSYTHNAANGAYTIVAKDVLKFADNDRAQAPKLSSGFLITAIDAVAKTLTLSPTGVGNAEYPSAGFVAIGGKEVCAFTRDPTAGNDADAKLLLHFDGADASTVFTDSSLSAKAVTTNGNAQIDTAEKKFGSAAGLFDGTGDFLSLADNADWTFAGNFTIDLQTKWNALAGAQVLWTHFTDVNNRYFLSASAAGALTFSIISAGATIVTMSSANGAVAADGAWRHIAVVRNGNAWAIYVNGVGVAATVDADALPNFTSQFRIGADHAGANGFNGWIDEFRVSGVARWTANFAAPQAPYDTSSQVLTLVRGLFGTTAIDHDVQDRVQVALNYDAWDAADVIRDLLVNYADVPDAYIPINAWRAETASFLNRVFTAIIVEPTGVDKLLSEIIEDAALSLWWDDVAALVRLRVLRAIPTDAMAFDQATYLEGSFSSREQPNERKSQIWRYFAKRNPCEPHEKEDNYRSVAANVDLESEADYGSPAIRKSFSRWIGFGGRTIADRANALYLSRYRDPPRRFNFATERNGITVPAIGQGYLVKGQALQDATGAPIARPIQITRLNPGDGKFDIEAEEMLVAEVDEEDLINRVIVIDGSTENVNLRTLHDTLYPAPTAQDVIDGVNLKCIVESGAIVSATGPNNVAGAPAFDVGAWPVGFPVTLIVNGRIEGKGGQGGRASSPNGIAGGPALYSRHAINLEVGTGEIWGGGGGGGSGEARFNSGTGQYRCSCGGGGGGGLSFGIGGIGMTCNGVKSADGSPGTLTDGGAGGASANANSGGAGGAPGFAGNAGAQGGIGSQIAPRGAGGAAGASIDGLSYVTVTVGPGDLRGPQIN